MNGRIFVDTNVLVYAYDRSEPHKQGRALDVLDRLTMTGVGVISTQVLSEFFIAVTRKIAIPMEVKEAYERIRNYLQSWTVVDLTGLTVLEAVRGTQTYQFSYWDAQVWASARLNQTSLVFSEDFASGSVIEGIRFVNPFSEDFSIDQWA